MAEFDESYGEARRHFWERVFVANVQKDNVHEAKAMADKALDIWEERWTVAKTVGYRIGEPYGLYKIRSLKDGRED